MSASATKGVAGFVDRNRVQPGTEGSAEIELTGREVHLEERILKDVVSQRPAAGVARQEGVEFLLISLHEGTEGFGVAIDVPLEQDLVGDSRFLFLLLSQGHRAPVDVPSDRGYGMIDASAGEGNCEFRDSREGACTPGPTGIR